MISFEDSMQNDEPEKVPFKGKPRVIDLAVLSLVSKQ